MDLSIEDILASVERAHQDANLLNGHATLSQFQTPDLQQLTRAWVAERVAPELLPYPTSLMEAIMAHIRKQIEFIEDMTARMEAGTSFSLVVIQTELERYKFLVRSFQRSRIAKIDAFLLHFLTQYDAQLLSADQNPLLSPQELHYLKSHANLQERHFNASFLSSFPPKLRRLDDRAGTGGVGMVEGPDPDRAVFVRCIGILAGTDDVGHGRLAGGRAETEGGHLPVTISCGFTLESEEQSDEAQNVNNNRSAEERTVSMRRGDIWIVRWRSVRDALAKGYCELI